MTHKLFLFLIKIVIIQKYILNYKQSIIAINFLGSGLLSLPSGKGYFYLLLYLSILHNILVPTLSAQLSF